MAGGRCCRAVQAGELLPTDPLFVLLGKLEQKLSYSFSVLFYFTSWRLEMPIVNDLLVWA